MRREYRKGLILFSILCWTVAFAACAVQERTETPGTTDSAATGALIPSAAGPLEETATATPELTATPAPTNTPVPTSTPTPTPTPTPTSTPTPTPTNTPTPSPTPTGTAGDVCFSEAEYFFSEDTEVELSIKGDKQGYITYTMDGTEPAADGEIYSGALLLQANEGDFPNVYSIRAKAWYEDGTASDTYIHTYFLNHAIDSRYTTVVFSINGDPAELTDGPDGIMYGDNVFNRGREAERVVSIEALNSDGELLFSQRSGARVYGGSSREHAVKSLKLYARKEYEKGKGTFAFDLFGSVTVDGTEQIEKYDKLVLRNGGDDFQRAFLRDEISHRLAEDAGFATYEAVIPAVCYINGSYYGFYWLHESYCDKYFQYRNGKSDGEYIVLEGTDEYKSYTDDEAETAAAKAFNNMYHTYAYADLTDDVLYEELCSLVDVENYIQYMAFNIYVSNYDWPRGNFRCFRYYAAEGEEYGEGERDGRWRFLLHDTDVGYATYYSASDSAKRNDIAQVLGSDDGRVSPLLAALLKREDCRQYFIDVMLEFMDGIFSYESVEATITELCAERDTELTYYLKHLENLKQTQPGLEIYASETRVQNHIATILEFLKQRPAYIRQFLEEQFGIELPEPEETVLDSE